MEPIKKVYISGLGAVDGAYASMLHNMDKEAVFIYHRFPVECIGESQFHPLHNNSSGAGG